MDQFRSLLVALDPSLKRNDGGRCARHPELGRQDNIAEGAERARVGGEVVNGRSVGSSNERGCGHRGGEPTEESAAGKCGHPSRVREKEAHWQWGISARLSTHGERTARQLPDTILDIRFVRTVLGGTTVYQAL